MIMKNLLFLSLILLSVTGYTQSEKPLVVVNGIVIKPNLNFVDSIPVDQIQSLRTYESAVATSMYGEFLGSNGIIEIKTKPTSTGYIEIPETFRLTYGNAEPVVLLDGNKIEYEKINEINPANVNSIQMSRNIEYIKEWGLQSLNGIIRITSK
jgi:hypothetical protein